MFDQQKFEFHFARAQAERVAADRAVCQMSRAIHVRLAELHAECAWSFRAEEISFEVIPLQRRQGMFFRSGLATQGPNLAVSA